MSLTCTCDSGDEGQHHIEIKAVEAGDPAVKYPRFVAGERPAPPEDVGGVPGYEEFVRAVTRPRHHEYTAMIRWYGRPYDPGDIGAAEIVAGLAKLARRRTLGKAACLRSAGRQH